MILTSRILERVHCQVRLLEVNTYFDDQKSYSLVVSYILLTVFCVLCTSAIFKLYMYVPLYVVFALPMYFTLLCPVHPIHEYGNST